jgi:hypothetical protein
MAVGMLALSAAMAAVLYLIAPTQKSSQRPQLMVCPLSDPRENRDEMRLACRRALGLPSTGPEMNQSKSVWAEQSAAELTCVLDCTAKAENRGLSR